MVPLLLNLSDELGTRDAKSLFMKVWGQKEVKYEV